MISLFRLVLAAALALLAVGAIHADTVFVASDGLLVHMPRSTLKILGSPEVEIKDDYGLPKTVKIEQLNIAGTLKGNVIGWHPDYGPNFFIVSVVDSKSGRISTLPQNIIHCQIASGPTGYGVGFMRYFNNKTPENDTRYPDFLFQLRVLELPHKEDAMYPHRSRFLVSTPYHSAGSGLILFYLDEETDPGTGIKTLSAREVTTLKTDDRVGKSYRVINIDLIDPRQYQSNEIRADDPYAIAMWIDGTLGRGENWSHEKNVFKYLANDLRIATVDDSGDVPLLRIRQVSDEAGAFKGMSRYNSPTAITGGALINPDGDGFISYWFTKSQMPGEPGTYGALFEKETWSGRLTYNSEEKTFGMDDIWLSNDYRWPCAINGNSRPKYGDIFGETTDFIPNMFAWNHNPRIRGIGGKRKDDFKEVFIDSFVESDNACLDKKDFIEEKARWKMESRLIGTIIDADPAAVSTAKAAITPDETLRLTDEEKALVASGTKVNTVVYSWPYFAGPANPTREKIVSTPTFTSTSVEQVVKWEKSSYGGGFDAKIGYGNKAGVDFTMSALGGYATKNEKERQKTETTSEKIKEKKGTEVSIDHFGAEGFLFYSELLPKMKSQGTFRPWNTEVIMLMGLYGEPGLDEYTFPVTQFEMIVPVPSRLRRFNVKNPEEEWRAVSEPDAELKLSPLSKGLIARSISSAIKCDDPRCQSVKTDIAKWEKEAKLQELIILSEYTKDSVDTGVENKAIPYQFDSEKTFSFSEQVGKTEVTDSSWYAGFNFTVKPIVFGAIVDVTGKYTGALVYKKSDFRTDSYDLEFPKSDEKGGASRLEGITHAFTIKMDRLKVFMKANPRYFEGRKPPLIPDWNWNFDQDLLLVVTQLKP